MDEEQHDPAMEAMEASPDNNMEGMDMEAMEGMEGEGMDGMDDMDAMEGMDEDMEGEMDDMEGEAVEGMEGEGMEAEMDNPEEEKKARPKSRPKSKPKAAESVDFTKDPRVLWMIEQYVSQLADFDPNEERTRLTPDRIRILFNFLELDYQKLFVWTDFDTKELSWSYDLPPTFDQNQHYPVNTYSFVFFIKSNNNDDVTDNDRKKITMDGIETQLICDFVETEPLDDLLTRMNGDYLNKFLGENDWPEGVKKDFVASLHTFMATVTEQSNLQKGKTYLYIPNEDLNDVDTASKDKDLLQRLETTVIFWTRQIKELVQNQDVNNQGDGHSPLDEIKHWEDRFNNLKIVSQRLKEPKLKKINEVLEKASSSYLPHFTELTKDIEKGHEEAEDNLRFLNLLSDPCKKIEAATPKEIPKLLPEVLNNVRIIFELSKHYNTMDRMKSLLTKIGNQIIRRCCKKINKDDMLNGDVEKCMRDLDESIECCNQWRIICTRTQKIIKSHTESTVSWTLSGDEDKDNTIFAENEAFIQRCKDLKEICEGQLQFAQKGSNSRMPIFGGTRGSEWTTSLNELKNEFERYLTKIKQLEYDILDVKITKWHDDYGQVFKEQVKSIENIYNTIIMMTFKYVSTIEDAVEMLENFHVLAKRPTVIEFVQTKAALEVYRMFEAEIKEVEELYDTHTNPHKNKRPPMPFSHPEFAGNAIWIQSLIVRIDKARDTLETMNFIPQHEKHKDVIEKYQKLKLTLDNHISKTEFEKWLNNINDMNNNEAIDKALAETFLKIERIEEKDDSKANIKQALAKDAKDAKDGKDSKDKDAAAEKQPEKKKKVQEILKSNFNTKLLKILIEVQYWNKLQGVITIPHTLARLNNDQDRLRILRENVMLIVRDYNNIMVLIDERERKLFEEHLNSLQKAYQYGHQKFNWSQQQDAFIINCRKECASKSQAIKFFQDKHWNIGQQFSKISMALAILIHKTIYELGHFISEQKDVMKQTMKFFKDSFEKVRTELMEMYKTLFLEKGRNIQKEWLNYITDLDKNLAKSLKQSVKASLLDFQKHIKGDASNIGQIFKIHTVLDTQTENSDNLPVKHDPDHPKLKSTIIQFIKDIIQTTSVVPRIEAVFRKDRQLAINQELQKAQEQDKNGAGFGGGRDVNFQSMTEEEKQQALVKKWALPREFHDDPAKEYVKQVNENKEIKNISTTIVDCVDMIRTAMENDCRTWKGQDFVHNLLAMKTERGKNRWLKQVQTSNFDQDPVQKYKAAIDQLDDVITDIKNEMQFKKEGFIEIDATLLKAELMEQGQNFIRYIFQILEKESKQDLQSFLTELTDTVAALKSDCPTLVELKKNLNLKKQVQDRKASLQARIAPIQKKFAYLLADDQSEICLVELTDEEKEQLNSLDAAWDKFNIGLVEAHALIQKHQQESKSYIETQLDEFKKEIIENQDNFRKQAPKEINIANSQAIQRIEEFRGKTKEYRVREEDFKFGLEIFDIEPSDYRELAQVERENDILMQVWQIKEDWDDMMDQWKDIQFFKLELKMMEDEAFEIEDRINKLPKEAKNWNITEALKGKIKIFRDTNPIMEDLHDVAMRPRHWNLLKSELKEDFRERDEDFTLEKILSLDLISHADNIAELTQSARKQLEIENKLAIIKEIWEKDDQTNMDVERKPSQHDNEMYFTIRSTDKIMSLIEEHSADLSRMKSSPFYRQFDETIDFWEDKIASITETLEMLVQVQSLWQYLESIFCGQPDIQALMAKEERLFQNVNSSFRFEMKKIYDTRKCYAALIENHAGNFIDTLKGMNGTLEEIKRNLNQFLEQKRQLFPRFFFLANEDLLEIIGQSKDPGPVNKHILKIYEGIKMLDCQPQGQRASKTFEVRKVIAPDDEELDFGTKAFLIESKIEVWLQQLSDTVRETLQKKFMEHHNSQNQGPKKLPDSNKMLAQIKTGKGQILLTYSMIEWTLAIQTALESMESFPATQPLKKVKANYKKKTEILVECVEKPGLQNQDRNKIVTMIIIEEHNREVVEKLHNDKSVTNKNHFSWVSQLRFFKEQDDGSDKMMIKIEQMNATFKYGYEYQGNNGRLVVTPLTDRAYMTLTNALDMKRGGAPQGPAGTGKTETVKDLGKSLAYYVVIQNCAPEMTHEGLGKTFIGLSLSGSWGCFDEFNRILLDVLSVITTYIDAVFQALRQGENNICTIDAASLRVNENTGLFITMNPGYAGRQELPDNLSALFRPVAMMVPDFQAICKIELMAEGFKLNEVLSKKITTIYEVMSRQLSKQSHYDYTLRAIKAVLRHSGRIKRSTPQFGSGDHTYEIELVIKAIRDMNLPRFIAEDVLLFDNLFIDLFAGCNEPDVDMDDLQIEIEQAMIRKGYMLDENIVVKCLQLYESKCTRHGNMVIGLTMAGKSTAWQILAEALNKLNKKEVLEREKSGKDTKADFKYKPVKFEIINPKSISLEELYGCMDNSQPPQWKTGILSTVLKEMCDSDSSFNRWMILDGPVDTLWIETMNSVLDDSKLLTLTNGDRIKIKENVRLLFEVENLNVASPATVSRAGMIYLDIDELGWKPIIKSWVLAKKPFGEDYTVMLNECIDKYLEKVLMIKKTNCKEIVKTSESACVRNFCNLYDCLSAQFKSVQNEDREAYLTYCEKWFVFSLIWSVGCTVEDQSRREIDSLIRDQGPMFPMSETVFEYFINTDRKDFAMWSEKFQKDEARLFKDRKFHEIQVQTVDSVRNRYVVQALLENPKTQVLLFGNSGVGKTSLVEGVIRSMTQTSFLSFTLNFSAGTTSNGVQEIIESYFQKGAKNKFKPKNSKSKALCFIDDLNMPRIDTFGSQPPLELVRQFMTYGYWYDRTAVQKNEILELQLLACMGMPGGGRAEISNRILSCFHCINYTTLDEASMTRIYKTIADAKFTQFNEEIKSLTDLMVLSTITLFKNLCENFLPTPSKSHYIFNMRDISKVFEGIYQADKSFVESKEQIIKMWGHEILRVFYDRLVDEKDQKILKKYLNDQLELQFQMNYEDNCMTDKKSDAVFVNFLQDDPEKKVYDEVKDFNKLREFLTDKLSAFNSTPKAVKMDIVLFKEAIIHVCKIYRVVNNQRGHCLLVGVGGSGRHSLSKLAAYLSGMRSDQLQIKSGFNLKDFRNKLREMYEKAATEKERNTTVFIFSDNDVQQESFLEDVQNQLNGGIVPNIFTNEDLIRIREEKNFKWCYKRDGKGANDPIEAQTEWFYQRVKDNMHMSICMSPIGETFRNYTRMYPALINNTTIDWFMAWPYEALLEVAEKFINEIKLEKSIKKGLAALSAYLHTTTQDQSEKMKRELKRIFYVTPTNFIELLKGYEKILKQKQTEIGAQVIKLDTGLEKLDQASKSVNIMTAESNIKSAEVNTIVEQMTKQSADIKIKKEAAQKQKVYIDAEKEKVGYEAQICDQIAAEAQAQLDLATPALEEAQKSVAGLDKKAINEIKAYNNPPKEVAKVMGAVMTYLKEGTSWTDIRKVMNDPKFINRIIEFDMDNIPDSTIKKIQTYTSKDDFLPGYMAKKSEMAGILCGWVRSVEEYHKALQIVLPKRKKLEQAIKDLAEKKARLQRLEDEYSILAQELEQLDAEFEKNNMDLQRNKNDLAQLQSKIDRGEKLVTGLGDEKIRWEISLANYKQSHFELSGDCVLAAAYMSYCGPFPSEYRQRLHLQWMKRIKEEAIPHDKKFTFIEFLSTPSQQRDWQVNGLPTDDFSSENGVFVTKGLRWALNIDPQSQAVVWIKNTYGDKLKIADPKDKKYLEKIKTAVMQGQTILMRDVGEYLDPTLENILNKAVTKVGKSQFVTMGEQEISYDDRFRLLITTRIPNPHYTPEVSTKVAVINFTVVESGLEEQCLGIVVKVEQPTLEEQRVTMVKNIARNKQELIELEDKILSRLQKSDQNILEDVQLIKTLSDSKDTSIDVQQQLESSEINMRRINENREQYKSCAKKAAALFFVLNDLNKINPMYQFSLDKYKDLFKKSIDEKDQAAGQQDQPTAKIEKTHTLNVYKDTCKSLFEKHKLLLALSMCIKLQISENKVDPKDYAFFLRGGVSMDGGEKKEEDKKPNHDWIKQTAWDQLLEVQKQLPSTFAGICYAVNVNAKEWKHWFQSTTPEPEDAQLPGEWVTKCEDPIKKMIILRCFRPDRVNFAIRNFIKQRMNSEEFIQSKPTSIQEIYEMSKPDIPIIYVLSSGTDPTAAIQNFAKVLNIPKLLQVSLGKGQGEKAKRLLEEAAEHGYWIFLSNCHLSVNLLPELESIMDEIFKKKINPAFRIYMSAVPIDEFPISLLQRSLKITQEPPRGIRNNMLRLYKNMDKRFTNCDKQQQFRKAVYGLCWFHTILIERQKFKSLGWCITYSFNDSDYKVCEDTLANYMGRKIEGVPPDNYNSKNEIPWIAIQQLIAQANYGGRVTDDRDRRLITTYAKEIFSQALVTETWRPKGTDGLHYQYPVDEQNIKNSGDDQNDIFTPDFFYTQIDTNMEKVDKPAAYGQHTNAEINSQITDSMELLDSILSLQPLIVSEGGKTVEQKTLEQLQKLKENLPQEIINVHLMKQHKKMDSCPMTTVLIQEVQRYNQLLELMMKSINDLEQGINGFKVITDVLEKMMKDLSDNKVPLAWSESYFSLKPLGSWITDLVARYKFFHDWYSTGQPSVFWISAFTYPTGFTTSLLQKYSRKANNPAIDCLQFDFIPRSEIPEELTEPAKDGSYIHGLYLEGANWNLDKMWLAEPNIMELEVQMPVIHFKPKEKKAKQATNTYSCPCYYYPIRKGIVGRDSFMMNIDLRLEPNGSADHWVKRGTALLMSLKD